MLSLQFVCGLRLSSNNLDLWFAFADMKRLRDDVFSNSQIKRPFGSSRGESYAPVFKFFQFRVVIC